jgi:hypothetical protein
MNENTFWIIVPSLLIGLLAWAVTNVQRIRIAAARAQMQRTLIERIASQEQLQSFLASEHGQRLLSNEAVDRSVHEKILQSAQMGSVLTVLGLALAACAFVDPRVPVGIGIVVVGLGIGFLVAAVVTHSLSRKWALSELQGEREKLNVT